MVSGGWVFMGNDDPLGPRWNFESGLWDMRGHAWRHKHSMSLRGWGEKLLIERSILSYSDVRSKYTQKTGGGGPGPGRGGRVGQRHGLVERC